MTIQTEVFANTTMRFFENVSRLVNLSMPERYRGHDEFNTFHANVFKILLQTITYQAIINALETRREEHDINGEGTEGIDVIDLLHFELQYYNTRYDYIQFPDPVIEMSRKQAIESADVAVGSIQKLLSKLPKWLRSVLEVLQEMLGIAKAFTL